MDYQLISRLLRLGHYLTHRSAWRSTSAILVCMADRFIASKSRILVENASCDNTISFLHARSLINHRV
jgi:hypothetical protein